MKVLVLGSGGREHALAWKIKQSPRLTNLFAIPGSAALAEIADCIDLPLSDLKGIAQWAFENKIDLTIVGPEVPLTEGVTDLFQEKGLKILGPNKKAARLEASKVFTKEFFEKYKIPTAQYAAFSDPDKAKDFLKKHADKQWVVKADGLAAGKGVLINKTLEEALTAIDRVMVQKEFGDSGNSVIIEEFLDGEEASFMVMADGTHALSLATSQDHKRLLEGDLGPNTGGMGAYSPAPIVDATMHETVMKTIIAPTLEGLTAEGSPYVGILYAGLMIVKGKPYTLEYNVRFGDPEAQCILPRLETDFLDLADATLEGRLDSFELKWKPGSAAVVVLAAEGYPANPKKGAVISGLDSSDEATILFHAGTKKIAGEFQVNGGRVLGVTGLGDSLQEALNKAYERIDKIKFEGMQLRKDIGAKAL